MVSEKTIEQLINKNGNDLITITLPTHRKGEETKQDPIRFKNQLTEAENKLKKAGKKDPEIQKLLKPALELLDKPLFWSHSDKSLAVYIYEDGFNYFKLPYDVKEMVYVNDHFLITPLLPMTSMDGTFCILTVSRENVRLLHCTRNEVSDITPEDAPTGVSEYLEVNPEKQLQFHTGAVGQDAQFFGHGANEEDRMIIVEQFFRELEKEVTRTLNERKDPLILAGLKENITLYNKINNYGRVIDSSIDKSPDEKSDKELKDEGWKIIQSYFLKDMYNSLDLFSEKTNDRVSNNLSEIIESTVMGKTQTIFISSGETKWGMYDAENHTVKYSNNPSDKDVELLNWLSIKGYNTGSNVYILPKEEMPMNSMVAAEYRF